MALFRKRQYYRSDVKADVNEEKYIVLINVSYNANFTVRVKVRKFHHSVVDH